MSSRFTVRNTSPIPTTVVPHAKSLASVRRPTEPPLEERTRALYPGFWFSLHLMGSMATDARGMQAYEDYTTTLANYFPCEVCKKHFRTFLHDNPIQRYRSMRNAQGREIGMATHSWMCHNAVNSRLGKPYMDWATFEQLWLTDTAHEIEPCTKECGK